MGVRNKLDAYRDLRALAAEERDEQSAVYHDYRRRGWGHDYSWEPKPGTNGREGEAVGWGRGIRDGHYLLLEHPTSVAGARYRVVSVRYYSDPSDMWVARLEFAPRSDGLVASHAEKSPEPRRSVFQTW